MKSHRMHMMEYDKDRAVDPQTFAELVHSQPAIYSISYEQNSKNQTKHVQTCMNGIWCILRIARHGRPADLRRIVHSQPAIYSILNKIQKIKLSKNANTIATAPDSKSKTLQYYNFRINLYRLLETYSNHLAISKFPLRVYVRPMTVLL